MSPNTSKFQNQVAITYRKKIFVLRNYMLNLLLTFAAMLCYSHVVKKGKWMETETETDQGAVGRQKVMSRRNAKGDGKMARKGKEREEGESSGWLLIRYKQDYEKHFQIDFSQVQYRQLAAASTGCYSTGSELQFNFGDKTTMF